MAGIGVVKALIKQTLEQLGLTVDGVAQTGGTLQQVTDLGSTTTTPITASGANTFGAPGVQTHIDGTLLVDEDLDVTGQILLQDGSLANPALLFKSTDGGSPLGFAVISANRMEIVANGATVARVQAGLFSMFAELNVAGQKLSNWDLVVEDNTAGSGAPNLLSATLDAAKLLTNFGATEKNFHTLAAAAAGIHNWFVSSDASDFLRVTANTGDVVILNGVASASAGFVESQDRYASCHLVSLDATTYLAREVQGSWNVDGVDAPHNFGSLVASIGYQASATAIVATSDGLTTGLIPTNASVVTTTVATDADDIVTLPAPVVGKKHRVYAGAAHEVRTVSGSNQTINNVDSDGTNELTLASGDAVTFECVSATAWIAYGYSSTGSALTLTPA
ncbi:hypothetical protein LCGC14_0724260 [marine sediment metagenome]|uniref:Uncharacterized protein n=1 Tax=marine sediment metagenome TaxID=412755 RepID=A0A0F9QFQ2_9ZZZZ